MAFTILGQKRTHLGEESTLENSKKPTRAPIMSKDGTRVFKNSLEALMVEEGLTLEQAKSELKKRKKWVANNAGFDGVGGVRSAARIKKMEETKVPGDWKKMKVVSLNYTYVGRRWTVHKPDGTVARCDERTVCAFGMKEFIKKVLKTTVITNFENIPGEVRNKLEYKKLMFNKEMIKFETFDDGDLGWDMFYWIYCTNCVQNKLPGILDAYKHVLNKDVPAEALMDHWDAMDAMKRYNLFNLSDIVGCLLPNKPEVKAGPNAKRFIVFPDDHSKVQHRWEQACIVPLGRVNDLWMGDDNPETNK